MLTPKRTLLLASSACLIATGAHAQPIEPGEARLEEIIVTAQRRAQNLQEVPIAVNAITAATAARLGVTDALSLAQAIPGLNFGRQANGNTPFIRGVGAGSGTIGNEPPVATVIDDVYVPTGAGASFDFNNIESVEVLKGPQGTLFGRNATGGVIHIHTRNPTHTPTADVSATYGNYQTAGVQFYGSTGFSDTVAANLALTFSKQYDGWGRNVVTGRDVFKGESWGARAKVLFEPTDRDSILLGYAFDRRTTTQGLALRSAPNTFSFGGFSPDRAGAGFYDATAVNDNPFRNFMHQGSLKAKHEFERASLISITGYTRFFTRAEIDSDTTPATYIHNNYTELGKTFTQELQLVSAPEADLQWIIGAFYLSDYSDFIADTKGTAFPGGAHQYMSTYMHTKSYSGFAQATAQILPRTNLTLGVRYTSDHRRFDGRLTLGLPGAAPTVSRGPFTDATTFSNLTGRFALDYRLSDDAMIYVAYNRGFKSGVYNLPSLSPSSTSGPAPVLPEDLNAYSAGFKSEFLDRRLRLNAEAWLYDYKNMQVVNQIPGAQVLTNAGAARIKGVDIDVTAAPVDNLTLTAAISIADGHYTRFPGGPTFYGAQITPQVGDSPAVCTMIPEASPTSPHPQIACNLKGKKTIQTIPLSVNLSATYRITTAVGPIDLAASWSHGGDFYWEAANDPDSHQKKTDLINASVQWSDQSERYSVRLWGRNLGQEKSFGYATNGAVANLKYSPAPPRTYGVTLSASY